MKLFTQMGLKKLKLIKKMHWNHQIMFRENNAYKQTVDVIK